MDDVFYGYILDGKLFGILYKEDNSLKQIIDELGFTDTKNLFKEIKWITHKPDMDMEDVDLMQYEYPTYLFIELCRKKNILETLKVQYKIMKFLNSKSGDPSFDGVLDEESEKELKAETKKELTDLKNAKVLEIFNQAYKVSGDYRNAEKYFVVDFDNERVLGS